MTKEQAPVKKRRSWMIDLAGVALILILFFTGGLKWLQIQVLGVFAGQPRVKTEVLATLSDEDWTWPLRDLDGGIHSLEEFRGQVLLVNEWATWCGPCVAEMPSIEALYADYGDQMGFVLVSGESPDRLLSFLESKGWDLPVYRPLKPSPAPLHSNSIPASFLINQEGQVVLRKIGAANWNGARIRSDLDELIAVSVAPAP